MRSGVAAAATGVGGVALTTAVLVPLSDVAPPEALGVAYVLPVLAASWMRPGPWPAVTALLGAAAFDVSLLPPTGQLALARAENWVALALRAAADERERLLEELVETEALRRSDDLKTALLRAVSHDLRTPLTAILTAAEALRSPHLAPGEHAALVDDAAGEAMRLSRPVDQLLDLARREAAAAPRFAWCSPAEVLEAAIDGLGLPAGTFRLSVAPDLPALPADAAQLERAFANLLENAARWSGEDEVQVRVRQIGARVVVRVVDRGPGIPPDDVDRVFAPFERGGQPAPAAHRGPGLGLAIVRGFIEANGGRVRAGSVPGQGTTFVVELPVPAADRAGTPA